MSGKHIWKLLLIIIVFASSASHLVPWEDQPFAEYLEENSNSEEFTFLLDRAKEVVKVDDSMVTVYMPLKMIANEERIDLSEFFPQITLEDSLRNIEKRNTILLSALLKDSQTDLRPGLDIEGGIGVTLQIDPTALAGVEENVRKEKISKAIEILEARVNSYGTSEPIVRQVGDSQIEVQLARVSTKENPEILTILKRPALLEFREVHPSARPDTDPVPFGYEVMTYALESEGQIFDTSYFVSKFSTLTGKHVDEAKPVQNSVGAYEISISFNGEGADRFGSLTTKLAPQGQLAIVLDGKLHSAPVVREPILDGRGTLLGSYTQREAIETSNVLNNPLEFELTIVNLYEVGRRWRKMPSIQVSTLLRGAFPWSRFSCSATTC